MMRRLVGLVVGLWAVAAFGADHPLEKDKTGMRWIYPFEKARSAAEKADRLLLIKPVAFGTDRQGGW